MGGEGDLHRARKDLDPKVRSVVSELELLVPVSQYILVPGTAAPGMVQAGAGGSRSSVSHHLGTTHGTAWSPPHPLLGGDPGPQATQAEHMGAGKGYGVSVTPITDGAGVLQLLFPSGPPIRAPASHPVAAAPRAGQGTSCQLMFFPSLC